MAKYHLTNKAVEDLANIWNYTYDTWSEEQADKYYRELLEMCQWIANHPELGKSYEGVTQTLSGYKINKHIIFYRKMNPKYVEITRILHEMMDFKRQFD